MHFISQDTLNALRERFPAGARVRLISMQDKYAPPEGTLGTVVAVDDAGTIHVKWDNGSGLGVAYGEDSCERAD